MRLRCRAHNQYEAERTFGAGFMERKRDEARRAAAERKVAAAHAAPRTPATEVCTMPAGSACESATAQHDVDQDLLRCLKGLGVRVDQARMALEHSRESGESAIEQRLHAALKFVGARGRTYALHQAAMNCSGAAGVLPSKLAAL